MPTIAIIGSGIAALGCVHSLWRHFDLTVFDQNRHAGGHANTLVLDEAGREIHVDTGFMVYNEATYPNLTRLFRELKILGKPAAMSFSVQHQPGGLEYSGPGWNRSFAQRMNLFSRRHWRLLLDIKQFNRDAIASLDDPKLAGISVGQYVHERGFGDDFYNLYLVPVSAAVWSTTPDLMRELPASTLLRFLHNYGFLGPRSRRASLTVVGGAKTYVARILDPIRDRVRVNRPVIRIQRVGDGVKVVTADRMADTFDHVIIACHADQALKIIGDPEDIESRLLREFRYQPVTAVLHTDESVMPKTRGAWASWNHRVDRDAAGGAMPSTVYWMNRLQGVSHRQNYFVSINHEELIGPDRILHRIEYEHPLFSAAAISAQAELPNLNRQSPNQRVFFCGSYFRHGFHEDGLVSALDLCRVLQAKHGAAP